MPDTRRPDVYAADTINTLRQNIERLASQPNGTPLDLTHEQAVSVAAVQGQAAIAAALLAIADALSIRKTP